MGNDPHGDREENLAHIVDDFDKKQLNQHSMEERALRKLRRQRAVSKVLSGLGAGALVSLVLYLGMFLFGENPLIKKNYLRVVGLRPADDYRIQGCLFNMWQVRKAIDLYYAQHNDFPLDAEVLYTEGFLAQKIVCPATHARYIIKQGPNGYFFCCPDPAEHGVKEIGADVVAGSPAIERE